MTLARRLKTSLALCAIVVLTFTCNGCIVSSQYHDELANAPEITTPSATGVREANIAPADIVAHGEPKTVAPKVGTVLHGPHYFEDATTESGSNDGQFARTNEDFYAFFTTGFHFLLNANLYPVQILVTPPCTTMASDGMPSRDTCCGTFDATPLPRSTR